MRALPLCLLLILARPTYAAPQSDATPSKAMYFDWINSDWDGSWQSKTEANLAFFAWLNRQYGLQLDLYLLDAGNLDRSVYFLPPEERGKNEKAAAYGSLSSPRFQKKFPDGLAPIAAQAKTFGAQLGMWMGPDGFGATESDAAKRIDTILSLCRDFGFGLFKFDAACSDIDKGNNKYFVQAMQTCRTHVPELIVLNHRIASLDAKALEQTSTFLWEGKETYVDTHIWNAQTATHHRAGALSRGLPPHLRRTTEDHGVCLSSALDFWQDDLVLQAFNRSLLLAPEIYGNPFLLKDEEYPQLARLFAIHRRYRDVLVNAMVLPESSYGPTAVSRGSKDIRFITLRNLSWLPVTRKIRLDESIGLSPTATVDAQRFHPTEEFLGTYAYGKEITVVVEPFRALLVAVGNLARERLAIAGSPYQIINDLGGGNQVIVDLLGTPGTSAKVRVTKGSFTSATLDGKTAQQLLTAGVASIKFPGQPFRSELHRKLAALEAVPVPADAEALYEATAFAADSNALEVRSLLRAGKSKSKEVMAARNAFFESDAFRNKGIWDRYAFDGNPNSAMKVLGPERGPGAFRLDLGRIITLDRLLFSRVVSKQPATLAQTSIDGLTWYTQKLNTNGNAWELISATGSIWARFVRLDRAPEEVSEVTAYGHGGRIASHGFRASNLTQPFRKPVAAFSAKFRVDDFAEDAYLALEIPGVYGQEAVTAALRGAKREWIGAPDRAPSFAANVWEYRVQPVDGNYTYYFPLAPHMVGRTLEAVVLGFTDATTQIQPQIWLTTRDGGRKRIRLVLK